MWYSDRMALFNVLNNWSNITHLCIPSGLVLPNTLPEILCAFNSLLSLDLGGWQPNQWCRRQGQSEIPVSTLRALRLVLSCNISLFVEWLAKSGPFVYSIENLSVEVCVGKRQWELEGMETHLNLLLEACGPRLVHFSLKNLDDGTPLNHSE